MANGVQRVYSFNQQLQPYDIKDSAAGRTLLELQYFYGGASQPGGSTANNDGSPTGIAEIAPRGNPTVQYTFLADESL